MRIIIQILVSLIVVFLLNILFYFVSDDYKKFLEGLKQTEETNVDQIIDIGESIDIGGEEKVIDYVFTEKTNNISSEKQIELVFGKNYRSILELFSQYNLKQLEINTSLFDITDEYPDSYFEFYSPNVTLYFLSTKQYEEVIDILSYVSDSGSFTLNQVNNFGDKSLYINLRENIDDNYVRILMVKNGIVIGVKVHKNDYDTIKTILQKI